MNNIKILTLPVARYFSNKSRILIITRFCFGLYADLSSREQSP